MQHHEAIGLIRAAVPAHRSAARWADLGCGRGAFTLALAACLPPGSTIRAVDRDAAALAALPDTAGSVAIRKYHGDIEEEDFPLGASQDGVLLANVLHYIRHREAFVRKVCQSLQPGGALIVIEYDTARANPWVPYPVPFGQLGTLLQACGFRDTRQAGIRPSVYSSGMMYAAVAYR